MRRAICQAQPYLPQDEMVRAKRFLPCSCQISHATCLDKVNPTSKSHSFRLDDHQLNTTFAFSDGVVQRSVKKHLVAASSSYVPGNGKKMSRDGWIRCHTLLTGHLT